MVVTHAGGGGDAATDKAKSLGLSGRVATLKDGKVRLGDVCAGEGKREREGVATSAAAEAQRQSWWCDPFCPKGSAKDSMLSQMLHPGPLIPHSTP